MVNKSKDRANASLNDCFNQRNLIINNKNDCMITAIKTLITGLSFIKL